MNSIDEKIREYYAGKALSEEKVDKLLKRASRQGRRPAGWYYRLAGIAAILAIGLVGLHAWLEGPDTAARVLAEIAMNHRKNLDVEVASDQYQVVQERLDRLDFPILPARQALIRNYALVGGRYCSIQGGLAAQLKVRDKVSGELLTLYVTRLTEELADIAPMDRALDEVHIRLWQDNGRLFGLAAQSRDGDRDGGL